MSTIEKLRTPSFRLFPYSFARRARPASASPAPGLAAYRVERLLALVKRRSQDVDRTNEAVTRQIVTMGGDVFEIGLYKPEGAGNSEPPMIPRTWDMPAVLKAIPWLRLQNRNGRNIYIRPRGEHNLSLIDDLTAASIERMKAEGFHPALVVETSPGNFQAWLKHSRRLSKELGTAAARALAQEFEGDLGAADWRHFGRLAGFTNRKEKYKADGLFPFVMLRQANGLPYPEAGRFIAQIEQQVDRDRRESERRRAGIPRGSPSGVLRSIDSFRANPAYAGDGTRIDLAYAIYALAHGVPDAQIDDAIRSRDLTHKGNEKRQAEYVERTLRKAATIVDRGSRALGR
jgi:hypothetical protein